MKFKFRTKKLEKKGGNLVIDADSLEFHHSFKEENKEDICLQSIFSLGLEIRKDNTIKIKTEEEENKSYTFSDNNLFLYYRDKTRVKKNPLCTKKHNLRIKFQLEKPLIYWIYLLFCFVSIITLAFGVVGLIQYWQHDDVKVIGLITDSMLFVFGYVISLLFDYTRRKGAERVILNPLLSLLLTCISLLLGIILITIGLDIIRFEPGAS